MSIKVSDVRRAMKLWQRNARQHGQASEQAKQAFLAYRRLGDQFTAESNVRLTSYLLGSIDYPCEPEWMAEANAK